MVDVPAALPVAIPLVPIDATVPLEELLTTPLTALAKVVVAPLHTDEAPVIVPALGMGVTVTTVVVLPPFTVYVIVAVPPPIPVTMPVRAPIVATEVLLLLHVPLEVISPSVIVVPWQNVVAPVIVASGLFLSTDIVLPAVVTMS